MEKISLSNLKSILSSLLISCNSNMTVEQLNKDFFNCEGYNIPFRKMGFTNLEIFLKSIPETISVYGSGPMAQVAAKTTLRNEHIEKLVSLQKRPSRKKCNSRTNLCNIESVAVRNRGAYCNQSNVNSNTSYVNGNQSNVNSNQSNANYNQNHKSSSNSCLKKWERNVVSRNYSFPNGANKHIFPKIERDAMVNIQNKTDEHIVQEPIQKEVCRQTSKNSYSITELKSFRTENNLNILPNKQSVCFKTPDESDLKKNESVVKNTTISETSSHCDNLRKTDSEDAIPLLSKDDVIFQLDFPENMATCKDKIPCVNFPENIKQYQVIKIFVTEVNNPFKFWFHIHKENNELDNLMETMELFYGNIHRNDLIMKQSCVVVGQVCAAIFNNLWHRAEIRSEIKHGKIKVFFLDYGTVSFVEMDEVKYLPVQFCTLRAQALRGSLSHMRPVSRRWPRKAVYSFLAMVSDLMLYAKITGIDKKNETFYMILCDTNNNEVDIKINDQLIHEGYAHFDNKWTNNDLTVKEKIHWTASYPTFNMLESGDYPSFEEIGRLLAEGIDFEAIEEENIIEEIDGSVEEGISFLTYYDTFLDSNPFKIDVFKQYSL